MDVEGGTRELYLWTEAMGPFFKYASTVFPVPIVWCPLFMFNVTFKPVRPTWLVPSGPCNERVEEWAR